jgi:hypothetical protein
MNNPVLAPMFHTHFSPEGRKMGQLEVILPSDGAPFHYKQKSVWDQPLHKRKYLSFNNRNKAFPAEAVM